MKHIILIAAAIISSAAFANYDTNNLARVTAVIREADSCPVLKGLESSGKIEKLYSGKLQIANMKDKKALNNSWVELLDLVAWQRKVVESGLEVQKAQANLIKLQKDQIERLTKLVAMYQKVVETK